MIIADTHVVSEFMKPSPDAAVLSWAEGLSSAHLSICVVTVEEIERGLLALPEGRRRTGLRQRWDRLLSSFGDSIVAYDVPAAHETAQTLLKASRSGRKMHLADAQIAGICLSGGHELATRNVRDFEEVPTLTVINPFSPPAR